MSNWIKLSLNDKTKTGDIVWYGETEPTDEQTSKLTYTLEKTGWVILGYAGQTVKQILGEKQGVSIWRKTHELLAVMPKCPTTIKVREDATVFPGWYAITNDTPIQDGDVLVKTGKHWEFKPSNGHGYSPEKPHADLTGGGYKGNCPNMLWSYDVLAKYAVYRKLPESQGVSKCSRRPLNAHHKRPLPLP